MRASRIGVSWLRGTLVLSVGRARVRVRRLASAAREVRVGRIGFKNV